MTPCYTRHETAPGTHADIPHEHERLDMSETTDIEQPQTIDFEVNVTATNGVQVPLRVIVEYPEGYGFYAAKALQAMPDNMDGIWNELIHRQDASTIKVMLDSGHVMVDDDE